jgi:predicted regulator of Ras-like GTPase activity (Roadblock/LC7/MglB family)
MFQENLKRLVAETEGATAGLLMGFDGIAVDSYTVPPPTGQQGIDITTVGMEFSFILTQVRKAAEILEVGGVQEIAIRTDNLTFLIRVVSPEYFLALAVRPEGNFGKGRYLLRVTAPKLVAELA